MLISSIPAGAFYRIIADLRYEQWKVVAEYGRFDKGIDYDLVVLKKQGITLRFVWVLHLDGRLKARMRLCGDCARSMTPSKFRRIESHRVSFPGACTVSGFGFLGSFRRRGLGKSAFGPTSW